MTFSFRFCCDISTFLFRIRLLLFILRNLASYLLFHSTCTQANWSKLFELCFCLPETFINNNVYIYISTYEMFDFWFVDWIQRFSFLTWDLHISFCFFSFTDTIMLTLLHFPFNRWYAYPRSHIVYDWTYSSRFLLIN